jgi:hypothetical protein
MSLAAMFSSFRAHFQDRVDGLCLISLGGLMASLARSPLYWFFLNPKFSTLTLAAGCLLMLCGLTLLFRPRPGTGTPGRLIRQVAVLGFLCLLVTAWDAAADIPDPGALNPASMGGLTPEPEQQAPVDLKPVRGGVAYVRLNLAELYAMLDKGRTDFPAHFAFKAQVLRSPKLEARGHLLLRRTAVVCCLADSLELSFLAPLNTGAFDGVQGGDWVEVFGHLEKLEADKRDKALLAAVPKGEGPSMTLTNPGWRVAPEAVDLIRSPGFPYLFEFREQEPFAW